MLRSGGGSSGASSSSSSSSKVKTKGTLHHFFAKDSQNPAADAGKKEADNGGKHTEAPGEFSGGASGALHLKVSNDLPTLVSEDGATAVEVMIEKSGSEGKTERKRWRR